MEITKTANEDEWNELLARSDNATIYHTPEWKQFLEKTFNYKPRYLFAKDDVGDLVGMLPLFEVRSKLTGNRLSSVPFSHSCGIIGQDEVRDLLIKEGIELHTSLNNGYFEIRDNIKMEGFSHKNSFSTHILDLSFNIDEVWKKLDKSSVRWAVNKSKKIGLNAESSTNKEDLLQFYELNCTTKKDIGVPCHPWNFFRNMFSCLEGKVSLYVAKHGEEIVGGGIFEYFNNNVIYGYGAANPEFLKFHPYNSFIWQSIEDSCRDGYSTFDFGRTSYDNTGLMNFKKKWGTSEKKLYYAYYPNKAESFTGNRENKKYEIGSRIIKRIPIQMYKTFSDITFQHFG